MSNDYKDLARRLRGFEDIFAVVGPADAMTTNCDMCGKPIVIRYRKAGVRMCKACRDREYRARKKREAQRRKPSESLSEVAAGQYVAKMEKGMRQ